MALIRVLVVLLLGAGLARADALDLTWADLLPEGSQALPPQLSGLVEHGTTFEMPQMSGAVRNDYNGQEVRISGFVVPLDYEGTRVSVFMLVPFVGACVHVPPPPPNQLILVTVTHPYEPDGLFAPVTVRGTISTSATATELAMVGYAMVADQVSAYRMP